jgi:hypothetical protein
MDNSSNSTEGDNSVPLQGSLGDDAYYSMAYSATENLLTVGFGGIQTTKANLVKVAKNQISNLVSRIVIAQIDRQRGKVLRINGAMTNMIAAVLVAELHNKVKAIAFYDPDSSSYIVTCNKDGTYEIGRALWVEPDDEEGGE